MRFDNATLSSVTHLYVSDTDANSNNVNAFLGVLKSGDLVRVFDEDDSNVFLIAQIDSSSDETGYWDFTVTYVESNGSFTDGQNVVFTVSPIGPPGPAGPVGPQGMALFGESLSVAAVTSGDYNALFPILSTVAVVEEVFKVDMVTTDWTVPLPKPLLDSCQPDTLVPVGSTANKPVRTGVRIANGHISVSVDADDLQSCGGEVQVCVKVSGLRRGTDAAIKNGWF